MAALIALTIGSCGQAPATSTPPATASAQSVSPSTVVVEPGLALVRPYTQNPLEPPNVYSLADPTNPTLVRTIAAPISVAKFVSADTISYVAITNYFSGMTSAYDWADEVVTLDLRSGNSKSIATTTGAIDDFSWSPDGTTLAYERQTAAGWQLWLKRGEATSVPITRVTRPTYNEGPGDGVWVTFSRSGTYLALANTFSTGPHIQVFRVSDGTPVWSATKGGSPFWTRGADRLYYEDFAGEHAWEASNPAVANVAPDGWIDPAQSPDGCCVAYTVAAGTSPQIEIRDLQSGLARKVALALVGHPVYASPGVVWLWQMAKTDVSPYRPTGLALAYDLSSQRQVPLPFSGGPGQPSRVLDIWPH